MRYLLKLLAVGVFLSSPVALFAQTIVPSGGAPSGAASGDLGGNYPSPAVLNLAHVTSGPPKIIPALDGTTAFQVTKANGTTPVAVFDTTNSALNIGPTTITSSTNRLGVYASSTTQAFRAVGDGVLANISLERYSTDSAANNINFIKDRGTFATPTAVASGDNIGVVAWSAYDGAAAQQAALVTATVDTFTAATDLSSYMTFWTRPDGAGATTLERMRVTKTGGVNIGTYTTDPGAGNLNVTGNYFIGGSQIACANLSNAGTACPVNIGTSGATIPLLSTANTWASGQVFVAPVLGTPASGNASNLTNIPAGNLAGTVPATVMGNAGTVRDILLAANLNTTTDQAIPLTLPTGSTNFRFGGAQIGISISNPSISMTTAVCGLWTGAGKTGVTIVGSGASGVAMSGLTSSSLNTAGNMISLAPNTASTLAYNLTGNSPSNTIYFACSTAQGAPATADVTLTLTMLN